MRINKAPGEDYGYSKKNELASGIYMTLTKEDQGRIDFKNRRKQYQVKQNSVRVNYVKKAPHAINCGRSFDNILHTVAKLRSYTKTMEESTEYLLQGILYLYSDTLDYTFLHLRINISNLPSHKKRTVAVYIAKRWGKCIIEEGSMTALDREEIVRQVMIYYTSSRKITYQRVCYIVLL